MAATGQRYVGDHGDAEAQYLALLNAGAEFGRQYDLTIGVAFTEAQMSLLTTDMVWLVAQNVTLPDGTVQRVLVPQVYVRVADGDLRADGTLMAGASVTLQLQGNLTNSGSIRPSQHADQHDAGRQPRRQPTGHVSLTAGNDYRQTASDVRALQGDVSIAGANVTIDTADNTSTATQDLRMRQSGASLTFSSPVVNALQSMAGTMEAAGQTQDSRTQALATANTAMAAYNAYNSLATASALNISVSVGNSRSQSHSEQSASIAATSSVNAGGNLTITANGKEPGQGNITAIGANLSAGNNATLSATNDIELRAAQNTATRPAATAPRAPAWASASPSAVRKTASPSTPRPARRGAMPTARTPPTR
jgi:filamentous hemagglutinin